MTTYTLSIGNSEIDEETVIKCDIKSFEEASGIVQIIDVLMEHFDLSSSIDIILTDNTTKIGYYYDPDDKGDWK